MSSFDMPIPTLEHFATLEVKLANIHELGSGRAGMRRANSVLMTLYEIK